jgi:hypothetical protein
MKRQLKVLIFLVPVIALAFTPPFQATASTLALSTSGVTMNYSEVILRPIPETGTTTFFDFSNSSSSSLVEVKFEILDKTGAVIFTQTTPESFLKFGSKVRLTSTFYDSQFRKATEPLQVSLLVAYLDAGAGKTTRRVAQVSSPFKFTERPIATPTPTVTITLTPSPLPNPTVTVTPSALLSENSNLKSELTRVRQDLKSLTAKLKKICSNKPKPKGC